MIKISIKRNLNNDICQFTVKGHANYAPKGEDIVCAGISVLAQTAILGIINYAKVNCDYEIKDGYLNCSIPSEIDDNKREKINTILETMYLGFSNIVEGYSSHIKMKEEEVRNDVKNKSSVIR